MHQKRFSQSLPAQRVHTGRITLNIRAKGQGPLMLFLHGITANAAVFETLTARLSERFHTIAVDQRGHGHSDKPETGYEADDYADDIAGLIRRLDGGPAMIVGHSLGARNAVTLAARYPELVHSVAAIDFTPFIETEVLDALESRVRAGDQVFKDTQSVEAYLAKRYPKMPADAVRVRAESGYHATDDGLRPLACASAMAQTVTGLRADIAPAFREAAKPVLIMRGAESKLVSAAALEKTRRLRPDFPVAIIADADHYVHEEAPEAVLRALLNFIDP